MRITAAAPFTARSPLARRDFAPKLLRPTDGPSQNFDGTVDAGGTEREQTLFCVLLALDPIQMESGDGFIDTLPKEQAEVGFRDCLRELQPAPS